MIKLDLNHLSKEQNLKFNQIIKDIKYDYDKLINNISAEHVDNINWIVGSIASRNKYQSPLFIRCAQLTLIKFYNTEKNFLNVVSDDKALCNLINMHFVNINVTCSENFLSSIWRILRPPRQFIFSFLLIFLRFFSRKKVNMKKIRNKNITLIDTFVINNKSGDEGSIVNKIYKDRYYPELLENIDENLKSEIYFMPTIIGFINPYQIFKKIRDCNYNFIIPDDYLKFSDYLQALTQPFKLINLKLKNTKFNEFDVKDLLTEEKIRFSSDFISILAVLYFLFSKRFAEKKVKVRLLIDWYENQVIDRSLIKGFHTYFKNTPVYGYQGYIISKDLHIYSQPNYSEFIGKCVPDKVLVTGKGLKSSMREFYNKINVDVAPGFRFKKVFESKAVQFPKDFSVLVGLPINLNDCKLILENILKIYKNQQFNFKIKFYVKPHPTFTSVQMKKLVDDENLDFLEFLSGDFHESLDKVNLVISNASSICLEALTKKRFVIILGPESGILQNPIPASVSKKIWKIAYSYDELISEIIYFRGLSNLNFNQEFEYVKKNFFEPVNKKSILKFLNIETRN